MDDIVFHSLYSEANLTTLKHSLLYFNNIIIPSNNYFCSFGPNESHAHYLQLIPDEVHKEIEYLKDEKLVDVHRLENSHFNDIIKYYHAICEGINRLGRNRTYSTEQILEVCKYLNLDPNQPDLLSILNEATIFIAAICLMEFSVHNLVCCNDNIIIHETMNLGLKGFLQFAEENITDKNIEYRRLKRNILSQRVLSLNLPSFNFQTFDDVLEIKEKHKDELLALDNHLDDLSEKIELSPFDTGFNEAVDRLISHRIQPEINEFTKSISFSASRIVKNSSDPLKNFSLALGFSNCFPDYTKEIALAGISITVIESIFKDLGKTKKSIKASPYNLFISLKNK